MNYTYSIPTYGSFPQFSTDLSLDPVLTYAISGDASEYFVALC